MLNRKTLVSIIAIVCCADMAFGAASLRIGGTQNATGTTARAGTLRTGSVKLAGVTPKSSVSGGTATPTTIGRLATSTGGSSVGNSHGRISGHGSGASAAALDELERRVNALTDDYGRLDGQYDRLSNDVNYAATTATSANTGINNLRTRVDTVEGRINGLENQGVDTATINGLIDNKIGNFPTKNEVTTQINTASEALMDYADSTGMTETERQELTRLSSAVDTKLSISDAENTYATKTQLNNAIVGNESVLADYVQTTYANAHFATKPEVNTLSERVDSATTSVNSLNAMVSDQATVVANANNKVTALENAVVALDNAVSDKVGVTTYNNLVTEVSNALGGKADQSVVNGLDARITANASAIAANTTALSNKVTSEELQEAITNAQIGEVDEDAVLAIVERVVGENTTFVTTSTYTGDKETINAQLTQHGNKINALENKDDSLTASINALQLADESITTALNNKVDATYVTNKINEAQLGGGGNVDLSDYYNKDEVNTLLSNKINATTANATFETQTHAAATYANKVTTENALSQLNTDMANKVTAAQVSAAIAAAQLDGGDVDLSGYYNKDEADALFETQTHAAATYANKVTTENALSQLSADMANKINTETANATFETQTHAANTYANKVTTENALSQLNTDMANKVTAAQVSAAIAAAQLDGGDVDLSGYYNKDEADALFETQTHAAATYANKVTTENALSQLSADMANKINTETANATFETQTHAANTYANKVTTENALSQLTEDVANKINTTTANNTFETQTHAEATYANKVTTENALSQLTTDVANKINTTTANNTFETQTHATATYANKETTENALSQLNTDMANKANKDEVSAAEAAAKAYADSLALSGGDLSQEQIEEMVTSIVQTNMSSKVDVTTYNAYTTATDNALTTMNNKLAEKAPLSTVNTLTTTVEGNTTNIGTLSTQKADKSALETAQATLAAAIATAERSAKDYAEEYTNQKVMAGLCPDGQVEVTTENTVNGKTYIVNCVQSD